VADAIATLPSRPDERMQVCCARIDQGIRHAATSDVRTDDPARVSFKPGQFVTIEPVTEGHAAPRCSSISSAPSRPLALGITPVMSTTRRLHDTAADVDMHCVHAARALPEIIHRAELDGIFGGNDRLGSQIACESGGARRGRGRDARDRDRRRGRHEPLGRHLGR